MREEDGREQARWRSEDGEEGPRVDREVVQGAQGSLSRCRSGAVTSQAGRGAGAGLGPLPVALEQNSVLTFDDMHADLVLHVLSPSPGPSRRHTPSSTRRLVSPNLVVSLPLLPLPEPVHRPSQSSPPHEIVTASQQALALFRLPTLAVSLLPFASWDLRSFGVEETSLAVTVPEHVEMSHKGKGKEREVEHIEHAEHVQVVERWTAQVEWTLRIDSPLAPSERQSDDKEQPSVWLESTTAPRKVELVFASRAPADSTSRGRQRRSAAVLAGRRRSTSSSSGGGGVGREIGATSSAGLVEKAAEEEHSLELVYVRYSVPASPLVVVGQGALVDFIRTLLVALLVTLLPLASLLLALVGLDQPLAINLPPHLDTPQLTHHSKRKLDSRTSSLRLGAPAHKRRKYRDSAPPVASTSASHEPGPAAETAHLLEAAEAHVGKHAHLTRRRRWSVSTPASVPASRSASGSSATLQASPERVPGPSPWVPRLPVALVAALELVGALCAGVAAAWTELALLLWAVRQAILFATELVEEGWTVAKEVLRELPPGSARRASVQGSEGGSSEGGSGERRRSAMSSGHRCVSLPLHPAQLCGSVYMRCSRLTLGRSVQAQARVDPASPRHLLRLVSPTSARLASLGRTSLAQFDLIHL